MLKLSTITFISLFLFLSQVSAQTFKEQFNVLFSKEDTEGQIQLLTEWEKVDSNDPELFISYFNYYARQCQKEILTMGNKPKGDEVLQVNDHDTTQKEPLAFIYGDTYYEPELLRKGFDWISNGIKKHPNRLDMRFGKIYMLGETEDYEAFTNEIINTIDYSNVIKNKWTWADSKPLDNPQEFMLSSIQAYQFQLYNRENNELLDNMKRISETVLKYYPKHIESLSNLSIVYILHDQYDKALEVLLTAEKLNSKDYIVLGNIAQVHKLKGDTKNSIKYYELTVKHGDEQAKKYAQEQIQELKKK